MNHFTRTTQLLDRRAVPWILALAAAALAMIVVARFATDSQSRPAEQHRATQPAGAIEYQPGTVEVPRGWEIIDRRAGVTTWSDPSREDAVTVAAVESSTAPLAAVVADVAQSSKRLASTTHVAAPHELRVQHGGARDSAIMLAMTLRDPQGKVLYVRQIWRRDVRAEQDVVATWTSRDERWPTRPEDAVPEAVVR